MLRLNWNDLNLIVDNTNYLKCQPGFQFGPRIIYEHQFIYVVKGKGTANIQGISYPANEGDLFYYGPRIGHCFRADDVDPFEIIGMHFILAGTLEDAKRTAIADDIETTTSDSGSKNILFIGERGLEELRISDQINIGGSQFSDILLQIHAHFRADNSMTAVVNRGLFLHLLTMLHKHTHKVAEHLSPQLKTLYHLRTKLQQNAELSYSRIWLLDWTGYNEDYLSRNFRQQFGVSPHAYHLIQKIERAKDLLEHTHDTVTDISSRLHFTSIHYFCRVFKKHTGQSPLQYKKIREIF